MSNRRILWKSGLSSGNGNIHRRRVHSKSPLGRIGRADGASKMFNVVFFV